MAQKKCIVKRVTIGDYLDKVIMSNGPRSLINNHIRSTLWNLLTPPPPQWLSGLEARRIVIESGEHIDRWEVFKRDKGFCVYCGIKVSRKRWHLDHRIPICLGGEHSLTNVVVSCVECNLRKNSAIWTPKYKFGIPIDSVKEVIIDD